MNGFKEALKGEQNVDVTANNELTLKGNLKYKLYRVDIKPTGKGPSICPTKGCRFRNDVC